MEMTCRIAELRKGETVVCPFKLLGEGLTICPHFMEENVDLFCRLYLNQVECNPATRIIFRVCSGGAVPEYWVSHSERKKLPNIFENNNQ